MEDNRKVKVVNRTGNGVVCYSIPDMGNLVRTFQDGEEKILTYEEMRKLSYIPVGDVILNDYLVIKDQDVLEELNMHPEQEYFYTKDDIVQLMTTGSLDEFLDCLDFAPDGVLESIKTLSVELPLNDVAKRKAILEKLNFNVDNAVRNKQLVEQENDFDGSVKPIRERRAAARPKGDNDQSKTGSTGARRVVKS